MASSVGFCDEVVISSDPIRISLVEADAAYAKRDDFEMAKQSLMLYEEQMALDPKNAQARWKASRAAWWVGDQTTDKKEKIALYEKAIDFAKEALEINPDSVEAHFWLAGGYGSLGEEKGVMKSLMLLGPIRKELEDVIRLDPEYEGGGGYRVMGIIDYKVPGIAGGNKKRALKRLKKAYHIDDQNPFTLYYMAEYFFERKDNEKAHKYLEKLFALDGTAGDGPNIRLMQKRGEKLKERLN